MDDLGGYNVEMLCRVFWLEVIAIAFSSFNDAIDLCLPIRWGVSLIKFEASQAGNAEKLRAGSVCNSFLSLQALQDVF